MAVKSIAGSANPMYVDGRASEYLYKRWQCIKARLRCKHPKNHLWYSSVTLAPEWECYDNFKTWALSNGFRPELQIDRIDPDGPYSPDNCRWVTSKVNCRNRRSSSKVTAWGETKTYADWADDYRCIVNRLVLRTRCSRGMSPEVAMTTPVTRVIKPYKHKARAA